MKKGLLFVPFMTGMGGKETVIHNLFAAMNKQQSSHYNLKVYSIGGSFDYHWADGVPASVTEISKKRIIRTAYYASVLPLKMHKIIKQEKPDFIISVNPIMWTIAKYISKQMHINIPIIAWYHYSLSNKPIKPFILKSADYYLAISSGIKQELINRGIEAKRIFLVFNPIVSDGQLIPQPLKTKHFIYLGRLMLDGQKNLRELLTALSKVQGDWVLDVFGDPAQAQPIVEFAQQLKLDQKIIWHGFVSDPWNHIPKATALLLTSKYEGLPMVLCEAISHGVYIVSANMPTGPDDIVNQQNGQLYDPGDTVTLTRIIQKIVDNETELPQPADIQKTSVKFSPEAYLKRFNNAINAIVH